MNNEVASALIAKVKLVFAAEDTFLSFPLSNRVTFTRNELTSMPALATPQSLQVSKEYSLLVDTMPDSEIWQPLEHRSLSETYGEVLSTHRLAFSSRTADEEVAYQNANRILRLDDGSDTPAHASYKECRNRHIALVSKYKNEKSDADLSTDAALKVRWQEVREPQILQEIKELESEWETKGHRYEIEHAKHQASTLGARSPAATWAEWKGRFMPDLDQTTDATSNGAFYPSGFSPRNAFETSDWSKFTLSGDEVSTLRKEAPPEVNARLGPDQVDLDIESLSFEFNSVKVERPWFASKAFESRFWKLPDESKTICDGQTLCGYVAALVFARNLQIKLRQNSSKNTEAMERMTRVGALSLGTFHVAPAVQTGEGLPMVIRNTQVLESQRSPVTQLRPAVAAPAPVPVTPVLLRTSRLGSAGAERLTIRSATQVGKMLISRLPPRGLTKLPTVEAAPSPEDAPPTPVDDIYIMAFICKRLPLCPNPDPALQW